MNHYRALPEFPQYDRTKDPHFRNSEYFRRCRGSEIITLTGDRITTGHLAKVQYMRAVRLNRHGQWRNPPKKVENLRHLKFAAKSCVDCDSGSYCRCPISEHLVNEATDATSAYSREGQPPSPSYTAFLAASRSCFRPEVTQRPDTVPLPSGASLLQAHPSVALSSPYMPPLLGEAVLSAGIHAARRHIERERMCGGKLLTTKAALQVRRPKSALGLIGQEKSPWKMNEPPTPRKEDDDTSPLHPGLKKPSPYRRCI